MNVDNVIRWFDPNATYRDEVKRARGRAHAKIGGKAPPPVLLQYLFFSAGVFASPLIRQYRTTGSWPDLTSGRFLGNFAFSLVVGFIVFPRVIDTLAQSNAAAFSRLSTVFTAGIGWEQFSGLPTALASS
jgi:hypothetical protein